MSDRDTDVAIHDLTAEHRDSDEYEHAVVVTATVDGPGDRLAVRRRYEALPYHNDVVHSDALDENDELVDRPDAVHVHTKYYDDGETYLGDEHEQWLPSDRSVLGDATRLRDACRRHVRDGAASIYEQAPSR